MIGKKLSEFIDELFMHPELELVHHNTKYLISGYIGENELYTLSVDILGSNGHNVFKISNLSRNECVAKFEEAKIFDGLSIYEAEKDIEVLYG